MRLEIRIDHYYHSDPATAQGWDRVLAALTRIEKRLNSMAISEQDILDKVTAEQTVDASILALVNSLSAQIKAAGTDPVKLQAISDMLDARDTAFSAAVTANTLPAPTV